MEPVTNGAQVALAQETVDVRKRVWPVAFKDPSQWAVASVAPHPKAP